MRRDGVLGAGGKQKGQQGVEVTFQTLDGAGIRPRKTSAPALKTPTNATTVLKLDIPLRHGRSCECGDKIRNTSPS